MFRNIFLFFIYSHSFEALATEVKSPLFGNQYLYASNRLMNIDGQQLGKCFALELSKRDDLKFTSFSEYPDLFHYLTADPEYKIDYSTGNEPKLRLKVMAAKDASIDPVQLFSWSLDLNHGDVVKAILTIHELLRNEARFYRAWTPYPSSRNAMQKFFNKFIDIRGDLEERGAGYSGDHRGSWYRIWGSMLHYLQMAVVDYDPNRKKGSCTLSKHQFLAGVAGSITARLAEKVKLVIMQGHDPDQRKAEINQKGMIRWPRWSPP